jgi:tryptophanyl-tRNA synthetase
VDEIQHKIKKATTDMVEGVITYDPESRPEVANLLSIYAALEGCTPQAAAAHFADYNFGKFKPELAEFISSKIAPISQEFHKLMDNQDFLLATLQSGADKASEIAQVNIKQIKGIIGFI